MNEYNFFEEEIMSFSKADIEVFLRDFSDNSPLNVVPEKIALSPECSGVRMYEEPLVGISSVGDSIYNKLKEPDVVGENYLLPTEWLKGSQSVISIFNPLTQEIKKSNIGGEKPSNLWLHGRNEGQGYIVAAA